MRGASRVFRASKHAALIFGHPRHSRTLSSSMHVLAASENVDPAGTMAVEPPAKQARVAPPPPAAAPESFRVQRISDKASLPKRGSAKAAGYDISRWAGRRRGRLCGGGPIWAPALEFKRRAARAAAADAGRPTHARTRTRHALQRAAPCLQQDCSQHAGAGTFPSRPAPRRRRPAGRRPQRPSPAMTSPPLTPPVPRTPSSPRAARPASPPASASPSPRAPTAASRRGRASPPRASSTRGRAWWTRTTAGS